MADSFHAFCFSQRFIQTSPSPLRVIYPLRGIGQCFWRHFWLAQMGRGATGIYWVGEGMLLTSYSAQDGPLTTEHYLIQNADG